VRILLDENMPRKLLAALVAEGHEVDSVKSLQLQGIDNGALYQFARPITIFALRVTQSFQDVFSHSQPQD
jgi:hypothetical protein